MAAIDEKCDSRSPKFSRMEGWNDAAYYKSLAPMASCAFDLTVWLQQQTHQFLKIDEDPSEECNPSSDPQHQQVIEGLLGWLDA